MALNTTLLDEIMAELNKSSVKSAKKEKAAPKSNKTSSEVATDSLLEELFGDKEEKEPAAPLHREDAFKIVEVDLTPEKRRMPKAAIDAMREKERQMKADAKKIGFPWIDPDDLDQEEIAELWADGIVEQRTKKNGDEFFTLTSAARRKQVEQFRIALASWEIRQAYREIEKKATRLSTLEYYAYDAPALLRRKEARFDVAGTFRSYPLHKVNEGQIQLFFRDDLEEVQAKRLLDSLDHDGFLECCALLLQVICDTRRERYYFRVEKGEAANILWKRVHRTLSNLFFKREPKKRYTPPVQKKEQSWMDMIDDILASLSGETDDRSSEEEVSEAAADQEEEVFDLSEEDMLTDDQREYIKTPNLSVLKRAKRFIKNNTHPKSDAMTEAAKDASNGGLSMGEGKGLKKEVATITDGDAKTIGSEGEEMDSTFERLPSSNLSVEELVLSYQAVGNVWAKVSPRARKFGEVLMEQVEHNEKIMPRRAYAEAFNLDHKKFGSSQVESLLSEIKAAMEEEEVTPDTFTRFSSLKSSPMAALIG